MKRQYRISPQRNDQQLTEAEIARFRDPKRLLFNYENAVRRPKRPIYKDPKTFIGLVLIVLLAMLLSEIGHQQGEHPKSGKGQPEQLP